MNFLSLIEAKRDARVLTPAQLSESIAAYTGGQVPDYQMAAFLMAVYFRGLDPVETRTLTLAMRDSGERLQFPADPRPLVDKHSTGGVGDKVSLPLAPLLACLGFRVPMISGRGLGITGGTLDKLDSIPGFQTLLPSERIVEIVQRVGCAICGQTERMVPADRALYALRDVTGTVPSIPLIVASILSKKLAEGLRALVLDVKFGAAAFMATRSQARQLARAMVALGNDCGVRTRALLTNMDTPLGRTAGNWLEIREAVACLEGTADPPCKAAPQDAGRADRGAPGRTDCTASPENDLRDLVLTCAAHLLVQTGKARSLETARRRAEACLASGLPRRKWDEMLRAQGADLGAFQARLVPDHTAPTVLEIKAPKTGYLSVCGARIIGEVIRDLGGGRLTKDSVINYSVGLDQIAKPGQHLGTGATLARVHAANADQAQAAGTRLADAFKLSAQPPARRPLVAEVIGE